MDAIAKVKPKKKKKTINNLPMAILNRLQFVIEFKEDLTELAMESLLKSYEPFVLGSCTTSSVVPEKPLDVAAFRSATLLPGRKPYLQLPKLPQTLPPVSKKRKIYVQPKFPSLIPLLMTAKYSGTDIRHYHFVSQRNSFRKLAVSDDSFVINVVRFGSTLFLRRFPSYSTSNKNDAGFRFEEMCTTNSASNVDFNQLIAGRIGENRILMMAETDAINQVNGASIELKCTKSKISKFEEHNWWLQAFLNGTETIVHGRRAKGDDSIVTKFQHYDTSTLGNRQKKIQTLHRLHSILNFLYLNVAEEKSYMLRGCKDNTTNQYTTRLYEVINSVDREKLTFITYELLQTFFVDE